jgi:hypothetical protein
MEHGGATGPAYTRRVRAGVALALLGLLVIACAPNSPAGPALSSPPSASLPPSAPSTLEPHPSPTPVGSQVALGPLDAQGVPTSVDSEAVVTGARLADAIGTTTDATPILAGGWFHPPRIVRYCPAFQPDPAIDACYSFGLFEHRVGGAPIWITRGDVPKADEIAGAVERPVVLRLHTHDRRCGGEHAGAGCDARPVLDEIVWLGAAPDESPPPREVGTPPPSDITREEAIERATAESLPHTTPLALVSVAAAPIWVALPSEEISRGDIWVWVVVFKGTFVACSDCQAAQREEVFLDYVTGAHIMSRT